MNKSFTQLLTNLAKVKMAYFNAAQAAKLRHLNNQQYSEIDKSKKKARIFKLSKRTRNILKDICTALGKKSTIHGVNRLFEGNANRWERTVWLMVIISALFGAIFVCLLLSDRFSAGKLQTVVDSTRSPVYRIPFPAVTICNKNHINWERLEEAHSRFLPSEKNPEKLKLFNLIVSIYDEMEFAKFDIFKPLADQPLHLMDAVNFSLVYDFMTWKCGELLGDCFWRHFPMDCCAIFTKRRSKNGLCWSFNSLETEEGKMKKLVDDKYPWSTGDAGPGSGLSVRVFINPDKHVPNKFNERGISVMITEQNVWHNPPYFVAENTQTSIEIEPIIYFYDNDTRSLSSRLRECVFNDERNSIDFKSLQGYIYMIENCQSECHQEYLVRFCNCTIDIFFPPGQYRSCNSKDLLCLANNNDNFLYAHQPGEEQYVRNYYDGMICKCFRNCYSLNFVSDVRPSFLPADVRGNISYIDLDVHFRFSTMMVYRTSLVFGWIDLMVAFGGIAGLFLGCSLISGIELIYFAFVEVPLYIFGQTSSQKQLSDSTNSKSQSWATRNKIATIPQNNLNRNFAKNIRYNDKLNVTNLWYQYQMYK